MVGPATEIIGEVPSRDKSPSEVIILSFYSRGNNCCQIKPTKKQRSCWQKRFEFVLFFALSLRLLRLRAICFAPVPTSLSGRSYSVIAASEKNKLSIFKIKLFI